MNAKLFRLFVLALWLGAGTGNVSAQVYSNYVAGYWPAVFLVGSNLFNNPLQTSSNTLNVLFQTAPPGTTISLWNPANLTFDTTSTFTNGSWSINVMVPPGTGALVIAPSQFTNTFLGIFLNHDGSGFTGIPITPPPLFSGFNGVYLFGDKTAMSNMGTNIFLSIIGRLPYVGEQVTQLSSTSTYLGNGAWDSVPTLGIGKAAFIKIMFEPMPWLTIIYDDKNAIVSWPSSLTNWTLQTNNNLANGSWGNYAGLVANNTATNLSPTGNLFFRLSHP